jgi:hypothetical protein
MAFTLVTPQLMIARNAGALYGVTVGTADMASYTTLATLPGVTPASFLNTVYSASIGAALTTNVAKELVANLGITGDAAIKTATDYVVAQLNTGTPATRGSIINDVLSAFSGLTADATFGAFATAWNAQAANAVAYASVPGNATSAGTTFTLSTHQDNILASAKDDVITAPIIDNSNTLQSGDVVNGGAGNDTLQADIGNSQNFAITAQTSNIETVAIRAQAVASDSTNNNTASINQVQIDAQRMSNVTWWESNNSRADLLIEDVRIAANQITKDITIAMVETDPGHVDYGVYFDQYSLRNSTATSSVLNIQVLDTKAAAATDTATNTKPLLNVPYDQFKIIANGTLVTLALPNAAAADTYELMLAAFNTAIVNAGLASSVTATLGATFSVTDPLSNTIVQGKNIVLKTIGDQGFTVIENQTGWFNSSNTPVPNSSNIYTNLDTVSNSSTDLVTSKIILDDVGRGSTGGDLVVGGLSVGDTSQSGGVQRFEIEVRDNSKLQTINSTNNALMEVTIVNGVTNDTQQGAYGNINAKDAGRLTVNGQVSNLSLSGAAAGGVVTSAGFNVDATIPGANSNNGGVQHNQFGFSDVRLIDASTMKGDLAFTAEVTARSIKKYINLIDTQSNPATDNSSTPNSTVPNAATPNKGAAADFQYTSGAANDTMVVQLDSAVISSRSQLITGREDFSFNINGGAGNDKLTVYVNNTEIGGTQNWYNNQDLNENITIIGGNGSDTIRTPGAGDKFIYGGNTDGTGTGNDTIYSDNSGSQQNVVFTGTNLGATNIAVGTAVGTTGSLLNGGNLAGNPPTVGTNTSNTQWVNNVTAEWVFNTTDQVTAVAPARNINDLRSDNNTLGDNYIGYNLYKAALTVTFQGATSQIPVTLANNNTYTTTDLEINQAIKLAINSDPVLSKLLVAQDGPAHSLVVVSLIDGVMDTNDLTVNFITPVSILSLPGAPKGSVTLSLTEMNAAAAVYGLKGTNVTEANVLIEINKAMTALNTKGDYVTAMANDGGKDIVGADSVTTSDNLIYPANGNDVIVLGTTVGANTRLSSNETVIYNTSFSNDTIVNFMAAGNGIDHLDLTFGSLGGKVLVTPTTYTTNKSINVAILDTATVNSINGDAIAVAKLFNADNVAATGAQTHVYVAVNASDIGSVYTVADPVGKDNAVATLQGTIDLLTINGNVNDNVWHTLTQANFVDVAGFPVSGVKGYALLEGPSTTAAAPAGPVAVPVTGANATPFNAATADNALTIAAGNYTYNIVGFGAGDTLKFPAGNTPTITNADFTDGIVDVQFANAGLTTIIHLTGLSVANDGLLSSVAGFNTVFGAGTIS